MQAAGTPTEVLCLMNMVDKDELEEDDEYEGKLQYQDIYIYVYYYTCTTQRYFFKKLMLHNLEKNLSEYLLDTDNGHEEGIVIKHLRVENIYSVAELCLCIHTGLCQHIGKEHDTNNKVQCL